MGKVHSRKTNVQLQNKIIDGKSDEQIFKAVEEADGYGQAYIKKLRKLGKLTPELAQDLREAMKHVGNYAIPATIGIGATSLGNKKAYGGNLFAKNK